MIRGVGTVFWETIAPALMLAAPVLAVFGAVKHQPWGFIGSFFFVLPFALYLFAGNLWYLRLLGVALFILPLAGAVIQYWGVKKVTWEKVGSVLVLSLGIMGLYASYLLESSLLFYFLGASLLILPLAWTAFTYWGAKKATWVMTSGFLAAWLGFAGWLAYIWWFD